MTRVAFDTNVLVYAEFEANTSKGRRAEEMLARAANDAVIPLQVLGEMLHFTQRRRPAMFDEALSRTVHYQTLYIAPLTTHEAMANAGVMARRH